MGACAAKHLPTEPCEDVGAGPPLPSLLKRRCSGSPDTSNELRKSAPAAVLKDQFEDQVFRQVTGGRNPLESYEQSVFIHSRLGGIEDVYKLGKVIGTGSFGSVHSATDSRTGAVRAVKSVSKGSEVPPERIRMEVDILKSLDHPNVVKLYESFEDENCVFLSMELCAGGDLFDRVLSDGPNGFSEAQASCVVRQLCRAVVYMHSRHICHRDIKPENILFQTKDAVHKSTLKLVDFGTARRFDIGEGMKTKVGSLSYIAPQVLAGCYDNTCDLWSCGVVLYVLLCGYPPFHGRSQQHILAKIKMANVQFKEGWNRVSEEAKTLVSRFLTKDCKERITADEALHHEWLRGRAAGASKPLWDEGLSQRLLEFRACSRFQKAALQVAARELGDSQVRAIREAFLRLDSDGDGSLCPDEIREGLSSSSLGTEPEDVDDIISAMDTNASGKIDYTEFLAAMMERGSHLTDGVLRRAFGVFDLDGDGRISAQELAAVFCDRDGECGGDGRVFDRAAVAEIVREADRNGDGSIDFAEFVASLRGSCEDSSEEE